MFFLLCSSGCPGTHYPLASGSEVLGFSGMGGNSKGKNVSSTIWWKTAVSFPESVCVVKQDERQGVLQLNFPVSLLIPECNQGLSDFKWTKDYSLVLNRSKTLCCSSYSHFKKKKSHHTMLF